MNHFSVLPDETVGQILRELSVVDRLQCEGVNRRWRRIVREQGWTAQKKLSYEIIFEGASESQQKKFDNESLVALFRRIGKCLIELDLTWPTLRNTSDVYRWLHLLPSLKILKMDGHFIGELPGQISQGQLQQLEELYLDVHTNFDRATLVDVAKGCPQLRRLTFEDHCYTMDYMYFGHVVFFDEDIDELEQHPNLLDFQLYYPDNMPEGFDPTIVEQRWKRRKYNILCSRMLTDDIILRETLKELTITGNCLYYRSSSTGRRPPINIVKKLIEANFLPLLLTALSSTVDILQIEAASTLANLVGKCSPEQLRAVLRVGLVSKLMELLDSSQNPALLEHSIKAIRISIDAGPEFRGRCIQLGIIELLLKMVEMDKPTTVLRAVVWVFETLCKDMIPMDIILDILPALGKLIQNDDANTIKLSAIALCHIARRGNEETKLVVDLGVVPRLVSLLEHSDEFVRAAAISAIATIANGTLEQLQLVLDSGALRMLPTLLSLVPEDIWSHGDTILTEAIRFLIAVASLGEEWVQAVLDTGVIPTLIERTEPFLNKPVSDTFASLISIIASRGRSEHVLYLVDHGVVDKLCELFLFVDFPIDILVGLKNILQKAGARSEEVCQKIKSHPYKALEKIRNLRNHHSEDIQKVASEIINEFFPPQNRKKKKKQRRNRK